MFWDYRSESKIHNVRFILQLNFDNFYNHNRSREISKSQLNSLGKGVNNNLTRKDLIKVRVKIPIKEDNSFDKIVQQQIAERYDKIKQIKNLIISELGKITDIEVLM